MSDDGRVHCADDHVVDFVRTVRDAQRAIAGAHLRERFPTGRPSGRRALDRLSMMWQTAFVHAMGLDHVKPHACFAILPSTVHRLFGLQPLSGASRRYRCVHVK